MVPWLAQRPPRLPHVRVSANREGGQVLAVPGAWPETQGDLETAMRGLTEVVGESWPVHKPAGGGWSQPRFQRSAEETWTETAKRIADAVTRAADRVKAVFVVLGGDVRERTILADELPKALRDNVVIVEREVELTAPAFDEAAWAEESWRAALDARARLDEFRAQLDRPPGERRAVQGLDDTLTALRDGLVSDVLMRRPGVAGDGVDRPGHGRRRHRAGPAGRAGRYRSGHGPGQRGAGARGRGNRCGAALPRARGGGNRLGGRAAARAGGGRRARDLGVCGTGTGSAHGRV